MRIVVTVEWHGSMRVRQVITTHYLRTITGSAAYYGNALVLAVSSVANAEVGHWPDLVSNVPDHPANSFVFQLLLRKVVAVTS